MSRIQTGTINKTVFELSILSLEHTSLTKWAVYVVYHLALCSKVVWFGWGSRHKMPLVSKCWSKIFIQTVRD